MYHFTRCREFIESEEQGAELLIRRHIVRREETLEQYGPWVKDMDDNDDCINDEMLLPNSRCKVAILQCLSQNAVFDNFEREKIIEIVNGYENEHFDQDVICCEAFSMDSLQFTCSEANVVHMIGHNVGDDERIDRSSYTLVRKGDSSKKKYISLSDNDMSYFLSKIKAMKLLILSMCCKFVLSCMVMARVESDESVYVICAHGRIPGEAALFVSEMLYRKLSQNDFNIVAAFDDMQRRVIIHDTENQWDRANWFPCLMRKTKGEKPKLLRANWKDNENDIDDDVKGRFETFCNNKLDSEVDGGEEHILEGGYRSWRDGDEIGVQERAALRAVGFITTRNTYLLERGKVVNIDSFWSAQINFDSGLWPKTGDKRIWTDLWKVALTNVLKKCKDTDALTKCEQHLGNLVQLREIKVEKYSRGEDLDGVERNMSNEEKNHHGMLRVVVKALVFTIRRLYYTYSDKALYVVGLRKKDCTKYDVWDTQLPNKIRNYNYKSRLNECQTHLTAALKWRKKEYEQKKKYEWDETDTKKLERLILVIENTTLPAIKERLDALS